MMPFVWVGSYLLLNTIFHWLYCVVLSIVFCDKSIIFVRSIVLLANPEARSMRYDKTVLFPTDISKLDYCRVVLYSNTYSTWLV